MTEILSLQDLAEEAEPTRGPSTNSWAACFSTNSWLVC
jgi:hypothetical protein